VLYKTPFQVIMGDLEAKANVAPSSEESRIGRWVRDSFSSVDVFLTAVVT
jgi:hypothetical protein